MPETLVIQWARLGDLLHTRPLLDRLKRECPEERLCLTVDSRYEAIANRFPEVDRLLPIAIDKLVAHCRSDALLTDALQSLAIAGLAEKSFDRVINLTNHSAAILYSKPLNSKSEFGYGFAEGVQWTSLLKGRNGQSLTDESKPCHISDIWCSGIADSCESKVPEMLSKRDRISISGKLAIVCDAGDPERSLTEATVHALIECAVDCGIQDISLLGAYKADFPATSVQDLRGATTLDKLIDIFENTDYVIGPDTGALHLAAAVGCSVFGIYPSGAHPERTGPYAMDAQCLVAHNQGPVFQNDLAVTIANWLKCSSGHENRAANILVPHFRNGILAYVPNSRVTEVSKSETASLSIIISEFGQVHYADELLEGLRQCKLPKEVEIIVVSSGLSPADKAHALARTGSIAFVSDQHLSFAQANNLGVSKARCVWALLINNDCEISSQDFARLWSERQAGAITAPRLKYWDEVLQSQGIAIDGAGVHDIDAPFVSDKVQIDKPLAVSAATILLEKKLFMELDGFDEFYVNGYEDVDLCLRAKESGYSVKLADCEVRHYRSSSAGRFDTEDRNLQLLQRKWNTYFARTRKTNVKSIQPCPLMLLSDLQDIEVGPTIRWISPIERIGLKRGVDFEWIHSAAIDPLQLPRLLDSAETVFVFRSVGNSEVRNVLLNWHRQSGKRLFYDCDDLLINRFSVDSIRASLRRVFEDGVRELMDAADTCIAPSHQLHTLHEIEQSRQFVLSSIPMPEHFTRSVAESKDGIFRIGYAGGVSHQTDLALILPALEDLLETYPNVRFYWWGAHPGLLAQHPSVRRGGMWLRDYRLHLKRIQQVPIDLWLVPLADAVHNEVRSPIKAFEYGGSMQTALYSNCKPFSGMLGSEVNSLFVDNSANSWRTSIQRLIEDGVTSEVNSVNWHMRSKLERICLDLSAYREILNSLRIHTQTAISQDELCLA